MTGKGAGTRVTVLLVMLVLILLMASCSRPEQNGVEPGENGEGNGAVQLPPDDIVDTPPGVADPNDEELIIADLVILREGALWSMDPESGESEMIAGLPNGYTTVSGPVCSPGGERIYCILRDQDDKVWIACYQVNEDRWEIRFLQGATDWDGWTDGYLPSPDGAGVVWWRNHWDTTSIVAELFYTDLEQMSTEKVAVFRDDMLQPLGWSADGSQLVCRPVIHRDTDKTPAGLYLFKPDPGHGYREIVYLHELLDRTWLDFLEVETENNRSVELFYVGWNPHLDGDIWLTEVAYEYIFSDEIEVTLKRIRHDGSGYRRLDLQLDYGNIWRVDWHPAGSGFIAYTNQIAFPTKTYRLYLVDIESSGNKLLADGVQGASWRVKSSD